MYIFFSRSRSVNKPAHTEKRKTKIKMAKCGWEKYFSYIQLQLIRPVYMVTLLPVSNNQTERDEIKKKMRRFNETKNAKHTVSINETDRMSWMTAKKRRMQGRNISTSEGQKNRLTTNIQLERNEEKKCEKIKTKRKKEWKTTKINWQPRRWKDTRHTNFYARQLL